MPTMPHVRLSTPQASTAYSDYFDRYFNCFFPNDSTHSSYKTVGFKCHQLYNIKRTGIAQTHHAELSYV